MLEKIIRSFYYSLFFLAPLVLSSATSELFEFNKMMLIYAVTLLVLFTWSVKSILDRKIILRRTILDIPILIFVAVMIASTIFSIDIWTSILGYYGRFNGGLLSILSYVTLYYGAVTFFERENVKTLLKLSLLSSTAVILWGIPGRLGVDLSCFVFTGQWTNSCWTDAFRPSERMFSTLGQPNWLGAYLAVNFFFGLYFYLDAVFSSVKKITKQQILFFSYLTLSVVALLFTRSRSSYLGVTIALGAFVILSLPLLKTQSREFFKRLGLGLGAVALVCVLSLLIFKTGIPSVDNLLSFNSSKEVPEAQKVNDELTTSAEVTESLDIRRVVWKGAVELGKANPLLGTGPETFAYSYYQVRPREHNLTSEWDYLYNKAHNEYLNYFATTGYLGLITYGILILAFLGVSGLSVYKTAGQIKAQSYKDVNRRYGLEKALLAAWVTILVTNFFGFSTTTINLFFYAIPAFFLLIAYEDNRSYLTKKEFQLRLYKGLSLTLVGLTFFCGAVYLVLYYAADTKYALANAYMQSGDYQKGVSYLSEALAMHPEHVYEDKFSHALANVALIAAYQKEDALAKQYVKQADYYNARSLNASPKNPLYWKTRGKNYYLFYQISLDPAQLREAISALEQDRRLSPTDPKIPYTLSVFYSLLGDGEDDEAKAAQDKDRALEYALITTDLKPDYRDGFFLLGQLYRKYGDNEKAIEAFKKSLRLAPGDKEATLELKELKALP